MLGIPDPIVIKTITEFQGCQGSVQIKLSLTKITDINDRVDV